jgi:hypothetical protein
MLTLKEAENKGLKYGTDFVVMGNIAYKTGDRFLEGDKEITVGKIIDQVHFLNQYNECWHTGMFYDYRCRHCPALNDADCAPDSGKTPAEILTDNVKTAREAFKAAELKKWKEDIYDDYYQIGFIEEMSYHIIEGNFDRELCDFLNVEGNLLFDTMYRYYINHPETSINDGGEARTFMNNYARHYGYQESCM